MNYSRKKKKKQKLSKNKHRHKKLNTIQTHELHSNGMYQVSYGFEFQSMEFSEDNGKCTHLRTARK